MLAYLEKLGRHAASYRYVTDKMLSNFRYIGFIRRLFPGARIVHAVRDPMDMACSIYRKMFWGNIPYACDLLEIGRYYKSYTDLMNFWHKTFPGFIHDVRYESLVENQEKVTGEALKFCGLSWEKSCIEFQKNRRSIMTASALQVRNPLYRSGIGSSRNYEQYLEPLRRELEKRI